MTHLMSELSWEAFRDAVRRSDLVLVPVGTLEAHGGTPLGTDTIIPTAMATDLALPSGEVVVRFRPPR